MDRLLSRRLNTDIHSLNLSLAMRGQVMLGLKNFKTVDQTLWALPP